MRWECVQATVPGLALRELTPRRCTTRCFKNHYSPFHLALLYLARLFGEIPTCVKRRRKEPKAQRHQPVLTFLVFILIVKNGVSLRRNHRPCSVLNGDRHRIASLPPHRVASGTAPSNAHHHPQQDVGGGGALLAPGFFHRFTYT